MTIRAILAGTGSALPRTRVSNAELAERVDTSDEWIVERTGIRMRHIAGEGETTATLATDAAKAALEAANKEQLVAILTYHVVPGKVMSADIAGKELMVESVQGSKIEVNATSGVKVDDATVVAADIETSNGVIHVIDKVMMPAS